MATTTSFPLDGSGRNRPGAVDGEALAWDANGNLTGKGDLAFHYDFRNRLTRVTDASGAEVASYVYDAFNRRVSKTVDGVTEETVWSGWQPIEEYTDGELRERRVYGPGIDEVLRVETDLDGDGAVETRYHPITDRSGNVVATVGPDGTVLERYEISPYGERQILADALPPEVEQVRVVGGKLWLEISEEVIGERLAEAVAAGTLRVTDTAAGADLVITEVIQPILEGRHAGRRVVVGLETSPAPDTALELSIPAGALVDGFGNEASDPFLLSFAWPTSDAVLSDDSSPSVTRVSNKGGTVEIELTEEVDPALAEAEIQVDGQPLVWTLQDDRYTLRSDSTLTLGDHQLTVGTGALDLTGLGLAKPFETTVSVGTESATSYRAPNEREVASSTVGNQFAFHGRTVDPETGLMYFRNRYFDRELGRFVTPDPLGYVDGPNLYQYGLNDPVNAIDPMGLYGKDFHFGMTMFLARLAEFSPVEAALIAHSTQRPDEDERRPVTAGRRLTLAILHSKDEDHRNARSLATWHFPLSEVIDSDGLMHWAVVPGSDEAMAIAREGIRSGNIVMFGEGLHPLQDSFSHQGRPAAFFADPDAEVIAGYGHPRGGLLTHLLHQRFESSFPGMIYELA